MALGPHDNRLLAEMPFEEARRVVDAWHAYNLKLIDADGEERLQLIRKRGLRGIFGLLATGALVLVGVLITRRFLVPWACGIVTAVNVFTLLVVASYLWRRIDIEDVPRVKTLTVQEFLRLPRS